MVFLIHTKIYTALAYNLMEKSSAAAAYCVQYSGDPSPIFCSATGYLTEVSVVLLRHLSAYCFEVGQCYSLSLIYIFL